jgi:hypothetical protein
LYNYFKQLFAQVTNPPLDGIREEIITDISLRLVGITISLILYQNIVKVKNSESSNFKRRSG